MTSPESTSDSSWNTAGIPSALATDDMGTDPGSMPPRHQTSLLGIDIVTGQMTDDSLARPVIYNVVDHATTRVMSPNTMGALENQSADPMMECNTSLLLGQHLCQVCRELGSDMAVCAECGMVGHQSCMKMQLFQGFYFCRTCYDPIRGLHDMMEREQKIHEWRQHIKNQLRSWKKWRSTPWPPPLQLA